MFRKNQSRALTAGERKMAEAVFGKALDYDKVRIKKGRIGGPLHVDNSARTFGNSIYMHNLYQEDFSKASLPMQGLFIHEMTHVWQFQNRVMNLSLKDVWNMVSHRKDAYEYTLDKNKDLKDYGIEQQASIVQEYFLMGKTGTSAHHRRCQNQCDNNEKRDLFKAVLQKFLNDPAYPRPRRRPSGKTPGI